jgi:hypothetical protein
MLTALAATAVRALGSCRNTAGSGGSPAGRGIWVVGCAVIGGSGLVGARRMILVRGSFGGSAGSGGFSLGEGSFGPVTGQPA